VDALRAVKTRIEFLAEKTLEPPIYEAGVLADVPQRSVGEETKKGEKGRVVV
jgi:hypothetical protein